MCWRLEVRGGEGLRMEAAGWRQEGEAKHWRAEARRERLLISNLASNLRPCSSRLKPPEARREVECVFRTKVATIYHLKLDSEYKCLKR